MDRDFNSQIITFMEHFCYSQEIAAAAAPVAAPTTTLQEKAKSLDISNLLEPMPVPGINQSATSSTGHLPSSKIRLAPVLM
jgi:hypothetical protein